MVKTCEELVSVPPGIFTDDLGGGYETNLVRTRLFISLMYRLMSIANIVWRLSVFELTGSPFSSKIGAIIDDTPVCCAN